MNKTKKCCQQVTITEQIVNNIQLLQTGSHLLQYTVSNTSENSRPCAATLPSTIDHTPAATTATEPPNSCGHCSGLGPPKLTKCCKSWENGPCTSLASLPLGQERDHVEVTIDVGQSGGGPRERSRHSWPRNVLFNFYPLIYETMKPLIIWG